MDNQENETKVYKSKKTVRDAVKKYTENLIKDPEKCKRLREYHRAKSREYYQELKNARDKLRSLMPVVN